MSEDRPSTTRIAGRKSGLGSWVRPIPMSGTQSRVVFSLPLLVLTAHHTSFVPPRNGRPPSGLPIAPCRQARRTFLDISACIPADACAATHIRNLGSWPPGEPRLIGPESPGRGTSLSVLPGVSQQLLPTRRWSVRRRVRGLERGRRTGVDGSRTHRGRFCSTPQTVLKTAEPTGTQPPPRAVVGYSLLRDWSRDGAVSTR